MPIAIKTSMERKIQNFKALIFNEKTTIIALIGIFLLFCLYKIALPGIQYDEILFGNAALGGINQTFIRYSTGDLPVMLMSYIGALKAYIYYPIFKVFGVSAYSIRMPMILLSAFSFYFLYFALKHFFNKKLAIAAFALTILNPSVVFFSRYDMPTVIELTLKIFSLYFFAKYLKLNKNKYSLFIYLLFFLGIFNKLNFLWYINSFYLAAGLVFAKELKIKDGKINYRIVFKYLLSYLFFLGYYFLISHYFNLVEQFNFNFAERLNDFGTGVVKIINGDSFHVYLFGQNIYHFSHLVSVFILAVIFLSFINNILDLYRGKHNFDKKYWFFFIVFLLSIFQLFVTKKANGGWHYYTLFPGIIIVFVSSLQNITDHFAAKTIKKYFFCLAVLIIALYFILANIKCLKAYDKEPSNFYWSTAIYDLIEYTKKNDCNYFSVDWGIHNQLLTFDYKPEKYIEYSYWLEGRKFGVDWYNTGYFRKDKNYLFILHPEDKTKFKSAYDNFFKIQDFGVKIELVKEIKDKNGSIIFQIYKLE
jgi:4-amino-4-deoxy-L-arabinose transferase-like glycosyltransferase